MKKVSGFRFQVLGFLCWAFAAPVAWAVDCADFGRLDGGRLVRAPLTLSVTEGGRTAVRRDVRLAAADYLAQGWKRVVDLAPAPSADGREVYPAGWTETDAEIVRQYAERDAAPAARPPRKFSKLKVYGAIAQMGAWEQVKAWLEAKTVNGMSAWTAFMLAQEVSEQDPMFAPLAEEARQMLGLDAEAFETLLDGCVLEEGL